MNISGTAERIDFIKTGKKRVNIKVRSFRFALFLALLIWCAGFSIHAVFPYNESLIILHTPLKKIYSWFCHQDPEKTFYFKEFFLVCARCSGIYIGAAAAAFYSIFVLNKDIHLKPAVVLLFALPMLCDVIFYSIEIYSYSAAAAFLTGIIFGSAVIIFILSLIENSFFYDSWGVI
jgi:uncharacterized membrane protein